MTMMKQAQIRQWGSVDNFEYVDSVIPEALPGRLVVKNCAVGINPVDWKTRSGAGISGMLALDEPIVLGWDFAGEVVATGPETTGYAVGDRIFGMSAFPDLGHCYAEYIQVKVGDVAKIPENIGFVEAGAVPLAALTAYQSLFDIAGIQPGQKVLVQGGSGGVGHVAVQLAKNAGARVWASASTRNQEFLSTLGAHPIDYSQDDFSDFVEYFDIILDTVGGEVFQNSLKLLAQGGCIVTCPDPSQISEAREQGYDAHWVFVRPDRVQLETIAKALGEKELVVHIQQEFPFKELAQAHRLGEGGHVRGKIVLTF
ncbi:NADP-dependent oxidoreductase [Corynebacterium sp. sy017]|uniref:NADP-dependent oxidoreductase n=1 Tax=unclassified Corynebacterium TaxID=2624378 RepID=UPI001185A508|nr:MULTISPECIES: NADP-dependent oxidoreductase [unclassified Corynebacterium]MBP3088378.1 NADP-dependent oxidoreductase [Corynebacterium sp. sy017]TSD91694.1 NADP-dependent oxidoreductase [Corynebacterium sp. SY003]